MSGPAAGDYEPRQALFYEPVRTRKPTGEVAPTGFVFRFPRHIRWLSGATREGLIQNQMSSINTMMFRIRRDNKTVKIKPDWEFEAYIETEKRRFGVTGINPLANSKDELEFVAKSLNPGT